MLQLLGVQLYLDQKLWAQLCRLTQHQIRFFLPRAAGNGSQAAARQLEAVRNGLPYVQRVARLKYNRWSALITKGGPPNYN